MTRKLLQTKKTTLTYGISDVSTTIQLKNLLKLDGTPVAASDIGDILYGTFGPGTSKEEIFSINGANATVETNGNVTITGIVRGLKEVSPYDTGGFATDHASGEVVIFGNNPQLYEDIYDYIDNIAIGGGVDASTSAKGISKLSVDPASPTNPIAVGDNDPRIPTTGQSAALAGTQGVPSSTNKYVTFDNVYDAEVDQSQTTQNGTVEFGMTNTSSNKNKIVQSFIPVKTKIRGVKLYKSANTGTFTGTVTVELFADSSGSPTGSSLATATLSNAVYNALAVGEFEALFSAEYSMTAGSTYHLVVSASTADSSNHPNLGTNTTGGYANGSVKYYNVTDGYVAIATIDLYFKTLQGVTSQIGYVSISPTRKVLTVTPTIPVGDSTTAFNITNPSGSTFRYTYFGGTDPIIDSYYFKTGMIVNIQGENFSAGNNGIFTITSYGTNYFEIKNSSGVAENNKTLGSGTLKKTFSTIGSTTTRFDITNTSNQTYRYTFDGTGTSPFITATNFPVGTVVYIQAQNFNSANNGLFEITASGTNYFEVTNASGVAETDKTIGTGYISIGNKYTKPTGLKYIEVELVGAGGATQQRSSSGSNVGGGAGGYSKKMFTSSQLNSYELYTVGYHGKEMVTTLPIVASASVFKTVIGGAGTSNGTGGTSSGGDININGQTGTSDSNFIMGTSTPLGIGGLGTTTLGTGYGWGAVTNVYNNNTTDGGDGIIIITEYY